MPSISLIASVYNKVKEFEVLLLSLCNQTFKDFEVIAADDGSGPEIKKLINEFKHRKLLDIKHVWHEDKGFKKNRILNKAINASTADYLIFIDGDCLPKENFISQHNKHKAMNTVLCGNRVDLGKKFSDKFIIEENKPGNSGQKILSLFWDSIKSKDDRSTRVEEAIFIKSDLIHKIIRTKNPRLLGANFSIPKKLLEKINGFDENYAGPGIGEDTDIEYRLKLAGAKFKSVRNKAILFHLYHNPLAIRNDNLNYFEEVKKKKQYVCKNGLVKL